MTVTAIIVTHNSSSVLRACVHSLRSLMPSAEIIVVDNISTDGTRALCRDLDGVTLLVNPVNVGYGRACNQGAEHAHGSHVLFLNPDIEIVETDLQLLDRELGVSPFGLVAPMLARGDGGIREARHWILELATHVFKPLWPRELPELPKMIIRQTNWWPTGALLLVDREEFLDLGGFDRRFFLYYEDMDLAQRYRAAGLPLRRTAAVRGRHRGGASSTGDSAGAAVRNGWSYLSWLEYLCTWHGRDTAVRAARSTSALRRHIYLGLGLPARIGPASGRATRKRLEMAELDQFVRRQSAFVDQSAVPGFCPEARAIVSATPRWSGR